MKLKNRFVLYGIILMLLLIEPVKAASNPYKQYLSNGDTNCTWYAWKMAYEKAGVALPGWGNAKTWYESARKAGYSVGTTPKAKSIAVWEKAGGLGDIYGHVGYVERVSSDGKTLYIKDTSYKGMNGCVNTEDETYKECIKNGVSEETDRICYENAPKITCGFDLATEGKGIIGYIYLAEAPKSPSSNSGSSSNPTPSTPKKSSNNNLKTLKINDDEIKLEASKKEYQTEVEYEIDTITISAEVEDKKANLTGIGEQKLIVGENSFKLSVKAENGDTKEYTITVIRKDTIPIDMEISGGEVSTNPIEEKSAEKNTKNKIALIIAVLSGVLSVGIFISIIIDKLKKKKK